MYLIPSVFDIRSMYCAGETLLHEAVQMSLRVGLVKPNDHIVVVQMISDALVVKVCIRISLLHIRFEA